MIEDALLPLLIRSVLFPLPRTLGDHVTAQHGCSSWRLKEATTVRRALIGLL